MKKRYSKLLVSSILVIVLVGAVNSLIVMPSFLTAPGAVEQFPRASFALPSSQGGNGLTMSLTESVNGWQSRDLLANNTLSSNQRNAPAFSEPAPTSYSTAWQSISISSLTATYDVRDVQYATSSINSLIANDTGTGTYAQLAMRFMEVDKVNLTGIWIYYTSALAANLDIVNASTNAVKTPKGYPTIATYVLPSASVGWHKVNFNNNAITLQAGFYYWVVVNATNSGGALVYWSYISDAGGTEDGKCASAYQGDWYDETVLHNVGGKPYLNLMLMVDVLPVDPANPSQVRTYSSPLQVAMNETNSNTQLLSAITRIPVGTSTFALRTNTSVTFTAIWNARFEYPQPSGVSTHYIAYDGLTLWNASFPDSGKPVNPYTWYNLTFKVTSVPQFWSQISPPVNITNTQGYLSSFAYGTTAGVRYYLINQTDLSSWLANSWLIATKSTYGVSSDLPFWVVAGLQFSYRVSTALVPSSCNLAFYNSTGYLNPADNLFISITSSPQLVVHTFTKSDVYTLFIFNQWDNGNEVALNEELTIDVLKPLCNVTVASINSPILGNSATAQFRFRNGTNSWTPMSPITVKINGTVTSSTYLGGVTTVSWTTASGGWRVGLNHVNITAVSGVYANFTIASFNIISPNARLTLNATLYARTYADIAPIGFTFLNLTGGSPQPFPSPPTLYRNGTSVSFASIGGGSYVYLLDTHMFVQAGSYHLNFTAIYSTYRATNITAVTLSKISMNLSIQTPQTSVTIGSSLSVSATLTYGNGTLAHDGFGIQFNFRVTYTNGSTLPTIKAAVINNGVASSSLLATSDMKSISVNATYTGNGITAYAASILVQNIQVVAGQGLSLMTIVIIGGGGGALVVALIGIAKYRGARKRTEVTKTKALVQTASLAQLIVVHLASGRALYSRSIGSEESADPNLISGFLSANQSIIAEVFKKQPGAGLKFADYGDYKVVSNVGNYVMATLFCTETAGEELQSVLQSFTQKFEKKYGPALQSWDGNMNAFKDADDIADEVFSMPLCSPYMLLEVPISTLNKDERAAVHSARILSGERGVFFMPRVVDFLLTKQSLKRGKAMDVINSLTKKGVFRQLTIEQAAQVVKSTTEKSG